MTIKPFVRKQRTAIRLVTFRRQLLPLLVAGCFGTAVANPLGPQVVNGQATFLNQGNVLSIANSPGTIINWQSFSINPGELTRFIQQNPDSAVLNRIIGQDPSHILGALQSNGRVFLVNPNGILFGQGAQVDVNGLVASTLNISNENFLNGKMLFKAGDKAGNLKNEGTISTPAGGQIFLIAPNVENSGIITSPKGEVLLAAGHSVQLVDSMNPDLRVVLSAPENEALNLGKVITSGGRTGIYGALVRQRGVVSADSVVVGENGKVVLKASRDALLETGSRTTATGVGKGGEIQVLGERVGLFGDAAIDVSGERGGGTVLGGGDYQGKNNTILNAKQTLLARDARIFADALTDGDGGKVILWGDQSTQAYGTISSRGGAITGNGGFVEISGKYLDMQAKVDTTAANGLTGTLLLDPTNLYIANSLAGATAAGMIGSDSALGGGGSFTGSTSGDSLLSMSTLSTSLGSSNVNVTSSSGAINVVDSITWGNSTSLTLTAATNITANASITNSSTGSLNLFGDGAIVVNNPISVGGNFTVAGSSGGVTQATSFAGNAQINGFDLAIQAGQIDLNPTGSLIAVRNTDFNSNNINIEGTIKHSPTTSTTGVTTLTASGSIALQGTIEGASTDTSGYTVKLQGGTITTGAGKTMSINGSGENTVIEFGNNKTWNNNGTVNLTGKSQIRLFDGTNTSTFTNSSTGQFNSSSTSNWSFYSNPGSQNGVINNNGLMTIDGTAAALQSFEAVFNQGATGTLTLANGATLSLQNAQTVQGAINLPAGNTLNISEFHDVPAGFTNTTFTGTGQLGLTSSAVQANFSNVNAPDTPLSVTGATTKISGGTSVFASASGLNSVLTLDGGTLAIKGGNFSVPTGASYNGTVGYYATGNLSVPASAGITTTTGSATLIGGWNGSTASPAATSAGGISLTNSHVSGSTVNLKAGTAGITTSGTGTSTSSTFLSGYVGLDSIGSINVLSLDGDVAARTTGAGSSITLQDPGALIVGSSAVGTVPSGISTNNGNIALTASLGLLHLAGPVSSGTGTLSLMSPGGGITQTSAISAPGGIKAVGNSVTLNAANTSGIIAGSSSTGNFEFETSQTLTLQTVAGTAGINAGANAVKLKSTHSGGINQDISAPLVAGQLGLISYGPVALTHSGNSFTSLAADLTAGSGTLNAFTSGALDIAGPITVDGTAVSGISTSNKFIKLKTGGALTVSNAISAGTGDIHISADTLTLNGSVTTSGAGVVSIKPATAGRKVTVGTSICAVEPCLAVYDLHQVNAPTIGIGSDDLGDLSGDIHVAAIENSGDFMPSDRHASTTRIGLLTGGGVTQSGAINVAELGIVAGGTVTLTQNNLVSKLAAKLGGATQPLTFTSNDSSGLMVASMSGGSVATDSDYSITGIKANGGNILLNSNSGPITVSSVIDTPAGNVTLNAAGNITVGANILTGPSGNITAVATGGNIAVSSNMDAGTAGIVTLTATSGSIGGTGTVKGQSLNTVASSGISLLSAVGGFSADNTGANSNISLTNTGALTLYNVKQSTAGSTGLVSINNTGALTTAVEHQVSTKGGSLSLIAHSPLTINGSISSTSGAIHLQAYGSGAGATGDILTIGASGGVTSTSGNITLMAGNGIVGATASNVTTSGTINKTENSNPPATPTAPTVADCTTNPTLTGCSTVLPTLATCTTAPTTAGCSAVLPTVDACVTNPAQSGCTAVLPTLATCTTAPTTAGCTAVLPTLDVCTAAPSTAGCSAVLPTLSSCTTNPTQIGCSAVLPTLSSCATNPTQTGCSAVLPTVSACTTNPTQTGCSIVLPTLSSCTTNPTQTGCSAVLPSMSTCTATPTLTGCTAVLPTLSQCSVTPTLEGCSVVVPTASKCVTNPSAPECQVVLPVTEAGPNPTPTNIVTETVTQTINTVVLAMTKPSSNQTQSGGGSSSGGGTSKPSESEGKKEDKKTTSSTDDSGAKKNEPAKKMYCN